MMAKLVLIIGALLTMAAAKIEESDTLDAGRKGLADQNFRLLSKTMETGLDSQLVEGSGDDEYDDDEYEYDEYDDDYSGDDMLTFSVDEDKSEIIPDDEDSDDIHFAEENDILYEYEADRDYGDDEYDMYDEYESVVDNKIEDGVVPGKEEKEAGGSISTAHIFLMLASALVTFALFMLAFFICRRSVTLKAKKKEKLVPFILDSALPSVKSTPIVKNYQRVPTSTKEFLQQHHQQQQQQQQQHTTLDMSETQKPLLT